LGGRGALGYREAIPQDSREAFDILAGAGPFPREHAEKPRRMVGFRDIAVHDYQDIVREIIRGHPDDLGRLCRMGCGVRGVAPEFAS
jgi:uncharacterized protein YutE (UPF0331/DUF86 family)